MPREGRLLKIRKEIKIRPKNGRSVGCPAQALTQAVASGAFALTHAPAEHTSRDGCSDLDGDVVLKNSNAYRQETSASLARIQDEVPHGSPTDI